MHLTASQSLSLPCVAGFRPHLVTASGQGSDEVLAAIYLADGVQAIDEYQATATTVQTRMNWAWDNGHIPTCLEEYGSSTTPRFCGVWVPYSGDAAWGYSMQDTATEYQKVFDAQTEGHARPAIGRAHV